MIVAEYVYAQKEVVGSNIIAVSTTYSSLSAVSHFSWRPGAITHPVEDSTWASPHTSCSNELIAD